MLRRKKIQAALVTSMATLLLAANAQALPYFNGPADGFGFDNTNLGLSADFVFPASQAPGFVQSGVTSTTLGLLSFDSVIADTATSIDRTIDWTLINNDPTNLTDFIIVFTGLGPNSSFFENATIDLDIDGFDPMVISRLQTAQDLFFFAGYRLTSADFDANNQATRTFRYTVDLPPGPNGPPELGIMYLTEFTVPEPATGFLFSSALLLAVGVGRRRSL